VLGDDPRLLWQREPKLALSTNSPVVRSYDLSEIVSAALLIGEPFFSKVVIIVPKPPTVLSPVFYIIKHFRT
jgi:hypothetical protein